MKIYQTPPPAKVLRVCIKKQGAKTQYLTLCDCTQQQLYDHIKKLIEKQRISIFQTGKLTNIQIREAVGSKNGKCVSLSFKGLEPQEVSNLIIKSLKP